ncbi:type II toxin-antitoxin system HicB family antitoxin [Stratiformator vulcanicus]|uniref:HicB family protein n=1 Tax=Stratiformator vulcanicus TaxID=2527980 RepID=A0A517R7U9_9PLAN|nr:type II toxin-antitoxin system HicB family antitoxin [Stratiformator vulcanicus]QDT39932.1 HicB family protein [Stratiformator vulcanicus]
MIEYQGYFGRIEFDDSADIFHGEVLGIRDVITFEGRSVEELKQAFRDSVDDYIEFCTERGEEPEKPFSGKFLLRLGPDLHRRVSAQAEASGKSLNAWISERLEESSAS